MATGPPPQRWPAGPLSAWEDQLHQILLSVCRVMRKIQQFGVCRPHWYMLQLSAFFFFFLYIYPWWPLTPSKNRRRNFTETGTCPERKHYLLISAELEKKMWGEVGRNALIENKTTSEKEKQSPNFMFAWEDFHHLSKRCLHIAYFWVHSFAILVYLGRRERNIMNEVKSRAWYHWSNKTSQHPDNTCQHCINYTNNS